MFLRNIPKNYISKICGRKLNVINIRWDEFSDEKDKHLSKEISDIHKKDSPQETSNKENSSGENKSPKDEYGVGGNQHSSKETSGKNDSTQETSKTEKSIFVNETSGKNDSTQEKSKAEKSRSTKVTAGKNDSTQEKSETEKSSSTKETSGKNDSTQEKSKTEKSISDKENSGKNDSTQETSKIGKSRLENKLYGTIFGYRRKDLSSKETLDEKDSSRKTRIKETPGVENKSFSSKFNLFNKIREHKGTIITLALGGACVYFYFHIVVDPITGRKKFHIFTKNQLYTLGEVQSTYLSKRFQKQIDNSGNHHKRVTQIIDNLVRDNKEMFVETGKEKWEVFVVERDDIVDAIALGNQNIFIFSGLLNKVENDDQLAALIAHHISHILLNHLAEMRSWTRLFWSTLMLPVLFVYRFLPGPLGTGLYPALFPLSVTLMKLPMKERIETEADKLCILLIARACYDPRKAKEFWMSMVDLKMAKTAKVKLIRTHPTTTNRFHNLDSLMPKAFNILAKHCAGDLHPFLRVAR